MIVKTKKHQPITNGSNGGVPPATRIRISGRFYVRVNQLNYLPRFCKKGQPSIMVYMVKAKPRTVGAVGRNNKGQFAKGNALATGHKKSHFGKGKSIQGSIFLQSIKRGLIGVHKKGRKSSFMMVKTKKHHREPTVSSVELISRVPPATRKRVFRGFYAGVNKGKASRLLTAPTGVIQKANLQNESQETDSKRQKRKPSTNGAHGRKPIRGLTGNSAQSDGKTVRLLTVRRARKG